MMSTLKSLILSALGKRPMCSVELQEYFGEKADNETIDRVLFQLRQGDWISHSGILVTIKGAQHIRWEINTWRAK